ncbi:MAG TPA: hypothetical protein VNP36_13380 [Burkholderiales bacterium]|nr:hypothetical protein [Burkholderiales bacterium]
MIWILLAALLMGGGSVAIGTLATGESLDALKSQIQHTVKDPERVRAAHQVAERWHDAGKDYFKAAHADQEALIALAKRHDAARAEVEAVNRRMDQRDAQAQHEFVAIRGSLRKALTREEWTALFKEAR